MTALILDNKDVPFSSDKLLQSVCDLEKLAIIRATMDKSLIISEILLDTKLPQTSGYRKINALIKDKLLIPDGIRLLTQGKNNIKVITYHSVTSKINIEFGKDVLDIKLKPVETSQS